MAAVRGADQRLVCCGEPLLPDILSQQFASVHVYEQMSVHWGPSKLYYTGDKRHVHECKYIHYIDYIMCILCVFLIFFL